MKYPELSLAGAALIMAAALIPATPTVAAALVAASKQCPPNCQSPQPEASQVKPIGTTGPMYPPPPMRKWANPKEECKSQDGTKSGLVSVGEGGRRCEYDLAGPGNRLKRLNLLN